MKRILLLSLALAYAAVLFAQSQPAPADTDKDGLAPPPAVTTFQSHPIYVLPNETIVEPRVISAPDPPPLKDFRPAKVVLWCIVGSDGKAHMIKVAKRHSMEADMKAVENLKLWKFSVGTTRKDNQLVVVLMKVDVVWR